jgi:hypothetical protein
MGTPKKQKIIKKAIQVALNRFLIRAENGSRTRDIHLGKVALYH